MKTAAHPLAMTIVAVSMISVLTAASASAQPSANAQAHPGRAKVWIGVGLLTSGALVLPMTAVRSSDGPAMDTGLGLMAAGTVMVWWGFHQERKASRPAAAVAVSLGRSKGLHVRVAW